MKNNKTRAINMGVSDISGYEVALSQVLSTDEEFPDEPATSQEQDLATQLDLKFDSSENQNEGVVSFFNVTEVAEKFQVVESERMKEFADSFFSQLFRKRFDSILVGGPKGCGVSTFLQYFPKLIVEERCPKALIGTKIYELFAEDFVDDDSETIQKKICELCGKLQKDEVKRAIIIIDNFQDVSLSFKSDFYSIIQGVKEAFGFEFLKFVLGADQEYLDKAVEVKPSFIEDSVGFAVWGYRESSKVVSELKYAIEDLSKIHGTIQCSKDILEEFYFLTNSDYVEDFLPYSEFLDAIDYLFGIAEKKGKKRISKSDIESVFAADFRSFRNSTKENIYLTAKHEAGHTLLALYYSNYVFFRGVRIVPVYSAGFNGLTFISSNKIINRKPDKEYIISELAFYLAGRCAQGSNDLGASADIANATKIAKEFIKTSGDYDIIGKNYFCDFEDASEEKRVDVEKETSALLELGYNRAKKILIQEKTAFDAIVEALMRKPYLTTKEVMRIWKKYKSKGEDSK